VKPSSLTLFLLSPQKTATIPRGKHRKELVEDGRVIKVEFCRTMGARVVKNKIVKAFSAQKDFQGAYSLLSQSQHGQLTMADNQFPSGQEFVGEALKHRGNVYLTSREVRKQQLVSLCIERACFCPSCSWARRITIIIRFRPTSHFCEKGEMVAPHNLLIRCR
jgi:hypothetical protein